MNESSGQIGRGAVAAGAAVVEVVLEVAIGAGLLLLFILALAWDPVDRRFGFHARRREERLNSRASAPITLASADGAYGIAPAAAA
jgi:hypothetical protein